MTAEDIKSNIDRLSRLSGDIAEEIDRLLNMQRLQEAEERLEKVRSILDEMSIGDFYIRSIDNKDLAVSKITKINKKNMEICSRNIHLDTYLDNYLSEISIYREEILLVNDIDRYTWTKIDEEKLDEIKNMAKTTIDNFFTINNEKVTDPCQ